MSLIVDKYDKDNLIDECWYDSSNVYYSKCYDKKDEYKDLEVVFVDGRAYKYLNMPIQSYLIFKNGGLSNSQGKALNEFIKKYKFEKLDKVDINMLNERKNKLLEERESIRKIITEEKVENYKHFENQDDNDNVFTEEKLAETKVNTKTDVPKYSFDDSEIKVGDRIYYGFISTDKENEYTVVSIPRNKLDNVTVVRSRIIGNYRSRIPVIKYK